MLFRFHSPLTQPVLPTFQVCLAVVVVVIFWNTSRVLKIRYYFLLSFVVASLLPHVKFKVCAAALCIMIHLDFPTPHLDIVLLSQGTGSNVALERQACLYHVTRPMDPSALLQIGSSWNYKQEVCGAERIKSFLKIKMEDRNEQESQKVVSSRYLAEINSIFFHLHSCLRAQFSSRPLCILNQDLLQSCTK